MAGFLFGPALRWFLFLERFLYGIFPVAFDLEHVRLGAGRFFLETFWFARFGHALATGGLYIIRFPSADCIANIVRSPSFKRRWFQRKSKCHK
jgi:hypothetical protein